MIGLINDNTNRRGIEIGKIDILKNFAFFEVDSSAEKDIVKGFRNAEYQGIKLVVELSKPDKKGSRKQEFQQQSFRKKKKKRRY